ncbi:MAG: SUMF1/EgtB/PvdO family nonheme iron enzyme [Chitinivibrionales bacterium]|nr:SUMF1/EgtB/PvdO family nonheme iron enzyme [Chitinivibrionales bacterium]
MKPIVSGSFRMGEYNGTTTSDMPQLTDRQVSKANTGKGEPDEHPVHTVTISTDFFLSETEVTINQFKQFDPSYDHAKRLSTGWGRRTDDGSSDVYALTNWYESVAFCEWLNSQEPGKQYRLPTEAEWEYAARAGTETLWPTGNTPPSGHDIANPWGLKGMFHLPAEWCHDWYDVYPEENVTDPVGPSWGHVKVVRGSRVSSHSRDAELHWTDYYIRTANRGAMAPSYPSVPDGITDLNPKCTYYGTLVGFRIVQGPLPSTQPSRYVAPMPGNCVKQSTDEHIAKGPDMQQPWFRARPILPMPPDDRDGQHTGPAGEFDVIRSAGFYSFEHVRNHSPGLEILDKGDMLAVYYTDETEQSPSMSFVGTRLQAGAEEWDWPEVWMDCADLPESKIR